MLEYYPITRGCFKKLIYFFCHTCGHAILYYYVLGTMCQVWVLLAGITKNLTASDLWSSLIIDWSAMIFGVGCPHNPTHSRCEDLIALQ